MRARLRALLVSLLGWTAACQRELPPDEPLPSEPAKRGEAIHEVAAAPAPSPLPVAPAELEPPPPATAPTAPELLLLDTVACRGTSAQSLADCTQRWRGLLRTPTAPAWIECSLTEETIRRWSPIAGELWRGRIDAPRADEDYCVVDRVDERLPHEAHRIEPLTNSRIAGITTAAEVDALGTHHDLENGPLRAVIGQSTRRVRFVSVYLDDLGPLLAIPSQTLMTRDEVRARLDARVTMDWSGARVGGARHFAPQVTVPDQRSAWAQTPIASLCVGELSTMSSCPFALPVQAAQGRRYLVMATTPLRSPDIIALTRRLLLQRIAEDGLSPSSP
ncbi:hypothetical protein G6O69_09510 [Pseudenhygromyxa sp. WMMC2535]|uniref:hypothetical protein n=1 Tax=Pseudenhygromyxa sp. WMMC2535 TaxID=2712867 RepID=UPI0015954639|nr:hypothetical protein [Pseudenhygromyxa sp. WMMC2535]NVB38068.1 hypothetical protein [Pseudenhygromyxa sp. WMMC2535]